MSKPLSAALGSWRGIKWLLVPPVQSPSSSRCQSGAKGTWWKYKWSPLLECHADNEPLHGVSYSNFKSHSGLKVTLAKFFSFWSLPARTAVIFSRTVVPCQSSDLTYTLFSGDFFFNPVLTCAVQSHLWSIFPTGTWVLEDQHAVCFVFPAGIPEDVTIFSWYYRWGTKAPLMGFFFFSKHWPYWLLSVRTANTGKECTRNSCFSSDENMRH